MVHFVIGTGRSGTTITARSLGLHPDLLFVDEPRFPFDILLPLALGRIDRDEFERRLGIEGDGSGKEPMKFLRRMREHYGCRLGTTGYASIRAFTLSACRRYAASLPADLESRLEGLGGTVREIASETARWLGPRSWIVKQPNLCLHLDHAVRAFPAARFIHVVREPFDVLASRLDRGFQGTFESAFAVWKDRLKGAFSIARRHPGKVHHLRLEDLVADPARSLGSACEVLGIDHAPLEHEVSNGVAHIGRGRCRFRPDEVKRVRIVCQTLPEMRILYPGTRG
jgi:hypothetical protein